MRTACFSVSSGREIYLTPLLTPPEEDPLEADTSGGRCLWWQNPLEGTWDQEARQEVTSYPPGDRQTPVKYYLVPNFVCWWYLLTVP